MSESAKLLAVDNEFAKWVGKFQLAWGAVELETSYAVGKFLNITNEEAHLVTTRMPFAVKASLLRSLIARKKPVNQKKIVTALNKIQNESKRNVFAHAFLVSNPKSVTFYDRVWEGGLVTKRYEFTLDQYKNHVAQLYGAGQAFKEAAGITQEALNDFANAALSASTKA